MYVIFLLFVLIYSMALYSYVFYNTLTLSMRLYRVCVHADPVDEEDGRLGQHAQGHAWR